MKWIVEEEQRQENDFKGLENAQWTTKLPSAEKEKSADFPT